MPPKPQITPRKVGPVPGKTSSTKKATIKAREREQKMGPEARDLHRANGNFTVAKRNVLARLRATAAWRQASKSEQSTMEDAEVQEKCQVQLRRLRDAKAVVDALREPKVKVVSKKDLEKQAGNRYRSKKCNVMKKLRDTNEYKNASKSQQAKMEHDTAARECATHLAAYEAAKAAARADSESLPDESQLSPTPGAKRDSKGKQKATIEDDYVVSDEDSDIPPHGPPPELQPLELSDEGDEEYDELADSSTDIE